MKVYVDFVLFLNFGFDFLLLLSTSYLLKRNISIKRLLLGAFIGSISTLCLFIRISSFALFFIKVIISIVMTISAFSFKNIHYTFKNVVHLYLNSIVLGGFLYMLNLQFSYDHVGFVFFHNGFSINFLLLLILSPIIIYLYIKQIKELKVTLKQYYKIEFNLNKHYSLNGFLDTGNQLKSIYFNKGISIINKDIIHENTKFFYEPINTVNGSGMMKCFKAKTVWIDGVSYHNVIFGVSDEYFKMDADVILNARILEE